MIWHIVFPICLTVGLAIGFHAGAPTVDRSRIGFVLAGSMSLVVAVACAVAGAAWAARRVLPVIVIAHGQFTPLYSHVVAPTIVAANVVAFVVMAGPRRKRASLQSWLAVALLAALLDGVLNAVSPGRYSVSWYVGKLLATLTSTSLLVLLLVDIASLYRKLFEFASRDALTGLANRNGLHERMPAILADARLGRGDVALLVIDIDYFKSYNDTFGHAGGDDALRRVAALLKQPLRRASDVVARIGGEEFVVLLPSTSAHGALLVGERIRADVEAAAIVNPAVPLGRVTVSIGISIVRDSSETNALDLFAIADRALYQAKADGRNRVVLETELPPVLVPEEIVAPFVDTVLGADLQLRFKRGMTFPRRP
jgi:diguanylate cyclase (GGDEF)-like protein